jgi:hypothetical protein
MMTMTDAAPVVLIQDKGMRSPVEIRGWLIGFGTSERDDSLAWASIEIYRLEAGGYMTHRIGYSLLYHSAGTTCMTRGREQKGDPATVDDLPDEAAPCPRCRPPRPQDLDDDDPIRFEFPRHTFDACDTAERTVEALTVIRHRDGTPPSVRYSQPVRDALAEAAQNDPAFMEINARTIRI